MQGAGITEWPLMRPITTENRFPCQTLVACLLLPYSLRRRRSNQCQTVAYAGVGRTAALRVMGRAGPGGRRLQDMGGSRDGVGDGPHPPEARPHTALAAQAPLGAAQGSPMAGPSGSGGATERAVCARGMCNMQREGGEGEG